ncbi:MAG: exosortase B [Pseudomonadota bacterium]|nr:exosortase B [Pseudomonadota bacterium]
METASRLAPANRTLTTFVLLLAGFLAMYLPTYFEMAKTVWTSDDEAHGPLIVLVCLYFAWTKRKAFAQAAGQDRPRVVPGALLFVFALLLFVVGTTQDILLMTLLSQILLFAGLILITVGLRALTVMAFPLLFLTFMFPIPPSILDLLTQPLKGGVSWATDVILYRLGYPIARQGVILAIGQYQLLVADACSGLRSLVSLSALGVLFIYITARPSRLHNLLMLASIVPLALLANLVRVIALVLITFYLGDEAGQGYLHGTAGMVMFMVAMLGLIGWDSLLARVLPGRPRPAAGSA